MRSYFLENYIILPSCPKIKHSQKQVRSTLKADLVVSKTWKLLLVSRGERTEKRQRGQRRHLLEHWQQGKEAGKELGASSEQKALMLF